MKKTSTVMEQFFMYLMLAVGVFLSLFPFYWMFIASTHSTAEIFSLPPHLLPGDQFLVNFNNLNQQVGFVRVALNSLIIAVTYTLLTVFLCSLVGYTFAKYNFKGKKIIFGIVLATMMVPYQATLVPLFSMMSKLGWNNTYAAVILPTLANAFGIFLMKQNMVKIPASLIEAARIDGCGEFKIFWRIALPIVRPALAALSLYMFMFQWNNFMWPLVILNKPTMYTIPVALSTLVGNSIIDYGQIMVGTTLATIPIMIVFILIQKQFISGIMSGSIKE